MRWSWGLVSNIPVVLYKRLVTGALLLALFDELNNVALAEGDVALALGKPLRAPQNNKRK